MHDQERCSQGRILVVDQEEWCRAFLSSVIKLLGFEDFKLVNTVPEALAALEEGPFDLVITDHRQPDHQQLLESARLRHPATRFIVMLHQRTLSPSSFTWSRWTSFTSPCAWTKSPARFATPCIRKTCARRKKN